MGGEQEEVREKMVKGQEKGSKTEERDIGRG